MAEHKEKTKFNDIIYYLITFFVIINILVSLSLYYFHINAQKAGIFEEIVNKSKTVGFSIVSVFEKGLENGIHLRSLKGVDEYLEKKTELTRELEYIAVTDEHGDLLYQSKDAKNNLRGSLKKFVQSTQAEKESLDPFNIFSSFNIPIRITFKNETVGYIHVGLSKKALDRSVMDVFYNIAVILICSIVAGYEFLGFIFRNSIQIPIEDLVRGLEALSERIFCVLETPRENETIGILHFKMNKMTKLINSRYQKITQIVSQGNISSSIKNLIKDNIDIINRKYVFSESGVEHNELKQSVEIIRLIIFLAILSEAILMTILPSYAQQFYQTNWLISKQEVGSLPVVVFTFFAIIGIALTDKFNKKYGLRNSLIGGMIVFGIGHFLAFWGDSLGVLLTTRAITAIGYGVTFVNCQKFVTTYSSVKERIQSYTIFVVASGSGFVCGTPIGGILVDNIGYSYTFLMSSICVFLAIIAVVKTISETQISRELTAGLKTDWKSILKQKKFLCTVILSAFSTRLIFTALLGFFFPLYLISLGNTQSEVGRIMMLYGTITLTSSPFAVKAVSKFKLPETAALYSSLIISLSFIGIWHFNNTLSVIIGLIVYTLSSVIHTSAMMTIIEKTSLETNMVSSSALLTFYFVVERTSMLLGPVCFGFILTISNFSKTLLAAGIFLFIANILYAASIFWMSNPKVRQAGQS